jgi:acetyltransferase-like isoleucine patch superfamily enzyme
MSRAVELLKTLVLRTMLKRRAPGLICDNTARIDRRALVVAPEPASLRIGAGTHVEQFATVNTYGGSITIGRGCSVGPYSLIYGHGDVTIGDDVLIASHVAVIPSNHNFREAGTIISQGTTDLGIVIESDVWIGAHVVILDGVRIGTGSVIAAGAVVASDVPPRSVMGGVPARPIGSRKEVPGPVLGV